MIKFFTDPHLGLVRRAHTTAESRLRLQQALFEQSMKAVTAQEPVVCLGDLFDTASNEEAVVIQGYKIASQCFAVLAGNHDSTNRENKVSSLNLIESILDDNSKCDTCIVRVNTSACFTFGKHTLVLVPHTLTQTQFESALSEAERIKGENLILCLHCNYDSPHDLDESSLNLSEKRAERLLETFSRILIGHEHIPRAAFGGRLQVLGNIHPTSFSDISDKYTWRLCDDGALIPTLVWAKNSGYRDLHYTELDGFNNLKGKQFINVHGVAKPKEMPAVAKNIHRLWAECPSALMIRNAVQVETEDFLDSTNDITKAADVLSRISEETKGTDIGVLWHKYLERASC